MMKLRSRLFCAYAVLLVIYSLLVLLPKPPAAILLQYHLSVTGLRLLYLTIIILLAAIWYAGFYGYSRLRAYTQLIRHEKDGEHVARISQGVFWLVMWLPVSFTMSEILNYIAQRHLVFLAPATIIDNYISLLFPLVAFIMIGLGARGLSQMARLRPAYTVLQSLLIVVVYVGLVYLRLVTTTPERASIYHLSIWVILTTIVAPYVYIWATGLFAMYQIYLYRRKVPGIVYRKSWNLLALGISWILILSIAFQYLTSLSAHLSKLSIYTLLIIVYAILLVLSAGFVLIAIGARKLRALEEV